MTGEQIGGIARAILSAAGGYFVGKGLIDANTAAQLAGAGAILITAAWSFFSKRTS